MSNCPNCGADRVDEGPGLGMWQCGTQDERYPTYTCRINQLNRELKQANAVIDAINTLLENGQTTLAVRRLDVDDAYYSVVAKDAVRKQVMNGCDDTLREALEACVEARDQYDKEAQ